MSMFRYITCLATSCALVCGIAAPAPAGGIVRQLPEDGGWARFDLELHVLGQDGQPRETLKGSETVRSVGRKTVGGRTCRWIELQFRFQPANRRREHVEILRLLIPEEEITAEDADPLEHVVEAWQRIPIRGDPGVAARLKDLNTLEAILAEVLHGPLEDAQELETQPTPCGLGNLECAGTAGTRAVPIDQGEVVRDVYRYEARLHKHAPFGVVRLRSEFRRELSSGATGDHRVSIFTLAEVGSGAKSAIPEAVEAKP
jgi:hypothetical protein